MTKFGNRFAKVLKENDEEKEAFDLSLDDETAVLFHASNLIVS